MLRTTISSTSRRTCSRCVRPAVRQDSFRWPSKLLERLREVHGILRERIRRVRALLEALVNDDLASFNDLLRARNIRNIIAQAQATVPQRRIP